MKDEQFLPAYKGQLTQIRCHFHNKEGPEIKNNKQNHFSLS